MDRPNDIWSSWPAWKRNKFYALLPKFNEYSAAPGQVPSEVTHEQIEAALCAFDINLKSLPDDEREDLVQEIYLDLRKKGAVDR